MSVLTDTHGCQRRPDKPDTFSGRHFTLTRVLFHLMNLIFKRLWHWISPSTHCALSGIQRLGALAHIKQPI